MGYRAWAQRAARKLNLSGWVRNVTDGTVEAVVHGATDAVNQLIADCHAGPALARVTAVDTKTLDAFDEAEGEFHQRETVDPDPP